MNRIEKVRLALMVLSHAKIKPETVEEVMAVLNKIIKELDLN